MTTKHKYPHPQARIEALGRLVLILMKALKKAGVDTEVMANEFLADQEAFIEMVAVVGKLEEVERFMSAVLAERESGTSEEVLIEKMNRGDFNHLLKPR